MIGTTVLLVTAVVVIVNVADVAPASTVTVGGGSATVESPLVSITTAPPVGAGPFSITALCVVVWPPTTLVGDNRSDATEGEFTVKLAVFITLS